MYDNLEAPDYIDPSESKGGSVDKFYEAYKKALVEAGFRYLASGAFRHGYLRKNTIIKVPRYGDGIIDNIVEAIAWRKYRNGATNRHIYLAPCRLLQNFCLMMPAVKIDYDNQPAWAINLTDPQYGLYRGRHVSYDYAFEITERKKIENKLGIRSQFWNSYGNEFRVEKLKEEPSFIPE